jgi:CBS domain-containing protein
VRPVADITMDIDLAARFLVNVMVTGGNEAERAACARAIHDRSDRSVGPFVSLSAHTVAAVRHAIAAGDVDTWFERAAGGTLFIDRVGQLGAAAQARLLSHLTAESRRGSGTAPGGAVLRARVIAGTDRSLRAELALGAFCEQLFYRLNVIHIDRGHPHQPGEDAMRARDIMSTPPHTCGPETDLATVAKLMWDHDCGFVPVLDASGAVAGVVTDRDICIATATRRLLPEHLTAAQTMATPVQTCKSDDILNDVLATMRRFQVRRIPVIDADGRLQGVISLNDIVLASTQKRSPQASEVVSTMAAICSHRQGEAALA